LEADNSLLVTLLSWILIEEVADSHAKCVSIFQG